MCMYHEMGIATAEPALFTAKLGFPKLLVALCVLFFATVMYASYFPPPLVLQLKVREFSAESVFQDPCLSYTLRDVICSYCSTCRYVQCETRVCPPPVC
jgi:DNA polymerase epsilon subunit 1